jgi:hypothetical protein
LRGDREEHRPFVVSSWPLYFARGEITTAVDSVPRHVATHMPVTVNTPTHTLIFGAAEDPPELYDLTTDPGEQTNLWDANPRQGAALMREAVRFLEDQDTPDHHLRPRREALEAWAEGGVSWNDEENKEAG